MFGYPGNIGFRKYLKPAKRILDGNWRDCYTKLSTRPYSQQWNWDSCFIAIGYAHYDEERAQKEMGSLLRAQWPNGMVPQIIFEPRALVCGSRFCAQTSGKSSLSPFSGVRRS